MNITHSGQLRSLFLKFFEGKGHAVIPSASVIPENDPTVLFTTAGMHPLVPYLLGEKHPMGRRLTDVQKCIRTDDIEDVGDDSHLTFFEMLGNWSLGDYFKREAITWSWEFLTSPEWLGIDKEKLAFSVFAGDEDAPRDDEAAGLWREMGVKDERIFFLPKKNNWWIAGQTGPCGPDTEMFIITDQEPCGPDCSPACDCGRYLEIWNDVFMQYEKLADGSFIPLKQQNVDTGMGLERTFCVLMGKKSVYDTDLFSDIISKIGELSGKTYGEEADATRSMRIIADHLRTSTFILGDDHGVTPSNADQGYVLRRLIRRAVRHGMTIGLPEGSTGAIAKVIIDQYRAVYPELGRNEAHILEQFKLEEERFQRTLKQGMREFEKLLGNIHNVAYSIDRLREQIMTLTKMTDSVDHFRKAEELADQVGKMIRPTPEMRETIEEFKEFIEATRTIENFFRKIESQIPQRLMEIDGRNAFKLYDTYGFPLEITVELAKEHGLSVDVEDFAERFRQHQIKSQAGAEQRFKGGLADANEETAKLHTATHLMHAALRKVLGDEVAQKGSNITAERLRFDFSFPRKMTDEEKKEVERLVNEAIAAAVPVECAEMTVEEAKEQGAIGLFESKYGERVKVYTMGPYSKEICGGPHAGNTGDLKSFKIKKEESSSAGVRRIKAAIGE